MISQTKPSKIKSFLPFDFAITKVCGTIHLAENGTRMGGIFNYPLVLISRHDLSSFSVQNLCSTIVTTSY